QKAAREARGKADVAGQKAEQAARDAAAAAADLLDKVADWTADNPDLAASGAGDAADRATLDGSQSEATTDGQTELDLDDRACLSGDIDELRSAEAGQIVAEVDHWSGHVQRTAAEKVATLRQRR